MRSERSRLVAILLFLLSQVFLNSLLRVRIPAGSRPAIPYGAGKSSRCCSYHWRIRQIERGSNRIKRERQPQGEREQGPIKNVSGKGVNGRCHPALFFDLMKRCRPDKPAESCRHDSQPDDFCQLGWAGDLLKANAKAEAQQHLSAQQQHSRFTEYVINRVT